jgi:glycosyltransferase involved in cell wall biosynthesis
VGKVPHDEIPAYMASADVFVLPSLSEGFGIAALEAMAMGLPIIATKVGGLLEIIKDGENGFLVEPRNPVEIAEKCVLLLTNDDLRASISRNNREKAKDYSWEKVIERLEKVYLHVLWERKLVQKKL